MKIGDLKRAACNTLNRRFYYNRRFEKLVDFLYYSPDRRTPSIPVSTTTSRYLEELRENGVVIIPGLFPEIADAVNQQYFEVLEGRREAADGRVIHEKDLGERNVNSGSRTAIVSYRDPLLQPMFWDKELCGLVYNYYRRQPYYRDQPMAVLNAPKAAVSQDVEYSSKFHVDYYHQISFQFIINDLDAGSTRLEYAVGSHLERRFGTDRFSYQDSEVSARYRIKDCVGPKGSVIIMDAGAGLHRGTYVPGRVRKIIGTTIDTGHSCNTYGKVDTVSGWGAFQAFPPHMKKMMNRVTL